MLRVAAQRENPDATPNRTARGVPAHGLLTLQAAAGNAAVARMVRPVVQRDLAAYTREHVEVEPSMGEGPPEMETSTADAPGIAAALAPLVAAGKVGSRPVRDMLQFWGTGATRSDVAAALRAAGYPRADDMADRLLDEHRIAVYSKDKTTIIPGLIWDTKIASGSQNVDVQTRRGLTNAERSAAASVYGPSINYDNIVLEESAVMSVGGYVRTTPWTINVPPGTLSGGGMGLPLLVHELAHSWQYLRGISMATTMYHAFKAVYDYGGEAELARRTAAGQGLNSFNTEQQGDIASDAYEIQNRLRPGDITKYTPYLAEFRSGAYR